MAKENASAGTGRHRNFNLSTDFEKNRPYLRGFYVEGFRSKQDVKIKGGTTYNDLLKRLEKLENSPLSSRAERHEKVRFISIDSRAGRSNPLYPFWTLATFTERQLLFFFFVMDILHEPGREKTVEEIRAGIRELIYKAVTADEEKEIPLSEDLVPKELIRLSELGLLNRRIERRRAYYSRPFGIPLNGAENALTFFSEIAPCGVIGYLMPGQKKVKTAPFRFKHHYVTSSLDSEVLSALFFAMRHKRKVRLLNVPQGCSYDEAEERTVIPLRIRISVSSGRQYAIVYDTVSRRLCALRLDRLREPVVGEAVPELFDEQRKRLDACTPHLFGVNTKEHETPATVSFTIGAGRDESFIVRRLQAEKRNGTVTQIASDEPGITLWRYETTTYDENELFMWMRTFIGRLRDVRFSSAQAEARFRESLAQTCALYDTEEVTDGE